eukprot:CAMPEP_0113266912 /NCGR_PEP_ID=MMETSP0008_2-20120614/20320_1 /TAXON_ID=97485 /ORGANISM="Prymnesium parvum" /LENGTH=154 /DNA_ID=CAMNT_0000115893 /DNA_START=301 /DNA_END=761 /DNA_ORIENTATION=+ /assembly_acc=CAM_ASM_000153
MEEALPLYSSPASAGMLLHLLSGAPSSAFSVSKLKTNEKPTKVAIELGTSLSEEAAASPPNAEPIIAHTLSSSFRPSTSAAAAVPPAKPAEIPPQRTPVACAALAASLSGSLSLHRIANVHAKPSAPTCAKLSHASRRTCAADCGGGRVPPRGG